MGPAMVLLVQEYFTFFFRHLCEFKCFLAIGREYGTSTNHFFMILEPFLMNKLLYTLNERRIIIRNHVLN